MAFAEETKIGQIEILANGRVQFREETQLYMDGVAIGNPTYHRSSAEVGHLDENDELVLDPLPVETSLGLSTNIDLTKLLEAVRTPAIRSAWKQKLLADKADMLAKQKQADDAKTEIAKAEESRLHAEAKARADEENRIAELVAKKMQNP